MTTVPSSPADWCVTLQLPKFDPKLGTLTDVTLTYNGEVTQSVFGENRSDANASFNFSTTATLSLSRKSGPVILSPTRTVFQQTGSLGAFDGRTDYAGRSGVTFSRTTPFLGQFDDSILAPYIGTGFVSFDSAAEVCSTLSLNGCMGITGASEIAGESLTIQYTYNAMSSIPEPTTSAALFGVVALGIVLRRRNAG